MEKRFNLSLEAVLLAAALALLSLSMFASSGKLPTEVVITGWLHVEDTQVEDVVLVVEVDDDRCQVAELLGNGRFIITLPVAAKARLVFQKPGHLEKVVLVDTRNAMNTRAAMKANRKVKFDVVLESEIKRTGRRYEGAVGTVSFVNGSGVMKVRHHEKLVAAQPSPVPSDH
ncbi:MAG: hypothetical protein JNM31_13075 [Flavobacteriales bacterium]|nr:hypothetical protein [Flavobacteriales bacterium]